METAPPESSPASAEPRRPKRRRRADARDRARPIKVLVNEEERAELERLADLAGVPVSTYLRQVGMNVRIRSRIDLEAARELARITGDLGRLGGLLKLWLAERRDQVPIADMNRALRSVLELAHEGRGVMAAVLKDKQRP